MPTAKFLYHPISLKVHEYYTLVLAGHIKVSGSHCSMTQEAYDIAIGKRKLSDLIPQLGQDSRLEAGLTK